LEAAQKHLDHASQRMLRQLLDCIKFVSHVPSGDRDIHLLLQKLLQLLGRRNFLNENTPKNTHFQAQMT